MLTTGSSSRTRGAPMSVASPPRTRSRASGVVKSARKTSVSDSSETSVSEESDSSVSDKSPKPSLVKDRVGATVKARGDKGNRRCRHVHTGLADIGSAHVCESTKCLDCGKDVTPCVRCLCYITKQNMKRHRSLCRGSRFEMQQAGTIGSRLRIGGKFTKTTKRPKRMPGRGDTKELFDEGNFMLCNNIMGKVNPNPNPNPNLNPNLNPNPNPNPFPPGLSRVRVQEPRHRGLASST